MTSSASRRRRPSSPEPVAVHPRLHVTCLEERRVLDAAVTLAVDQASIAENGGVAKFTATLSNASTQAVTVNLGFTGTATLTDDYTRTGTQIVIAAGSLSGYVTVTAVQDTVYEGNETVVVDITGVTNGTESRHAAGDGHDHGRRQPRRR